MNRLSDSPDLQTASLPQFNPVAQAASLRRHPHLWLLAGLLIAWAGYLAPWVAHPVAALNIIGLDLGEYVKFVPAVRSGQIHLWREAFYLPLATISAGLSAMASGTRRAVLRWLLAILAVIAALQALPPAWSPASLRSAEFRQQVIGMGLCSLLAIAGGFRLFRPLPRLPVVATFAGLAIAAAALPILQFRHLLPALTAIYDQPLSLGWGPYALVLGLVLAAIGATMPKPKEI